MHVYSELIKAQLEHLAADPTPGTRGRIYSKSVTEPVKVDDGTTIHKVLTDQMYEGIKDGMYPLGIPTSDIVLTSEMSASSGNFSTMSATPVDVTNLSVTITTSGKPIEIMLLGGTIGSGNPGGTTTSSEFFINRDGSNFNLGFIITMEALNATTVSSILPAGCIRYIDTVPAGTYTYKIQAKSSSSSIYSYVTKAFLYVREL